MAKKTMFNMKINADGFCWQVISKSDAKKRFANNKEVFVLCDEDNEFLVEDNTNFDEPWTFGIELGFMSNDSVKSFKQFCVVNYK